jgi:RNA polymerase sigma-70 factor (ECF subfamily)
MELAAAVAAGDELAASILDGRFRKRFESLARQHGIPFEDAKDVAQVALTHVFRQLRRSTFRGQSSLGSWVHTIASRRIKDYWRSRRRRNDLESFQTGAGTEITVQSSTEDLVVVQQALERMPPDERSVLLLHEREGFTLEEIGARVGLKKSAVWDRLLQAQAHFRDNVLGVGNAASRKRLKDRTHVSDC